MSTEARKAREDLATYKKKETGTVVCFFVSDHL